MVDLAVYDSAFGDEMHDALRMCAAEGPTAVDSQSGMTLVLRYEDIDRLSRDRRLTGVGLTHFDFMGIDRGPLRDWYGRLMFTNEGAVHNRLRMLVSRAFTPRAVEGLRRDASGLVAEAIESITADGGGDLVTAFGRVPIRLMCRLLGVPEADITVFGDWADALSPTFAFMDESQIAAATAAIVAMLDYVHVLADERRSDPGDDLITALLAAEEDGERLTHDELVDMVANLIVGGHDTTASQLGCTLLTLLRHPEEAERVRRLPELASSAATESIRFEPSIPGIPRTVVEPVEVAGREVHAGSLLLFSTAAANRQADVWHDPDTFDAGRFTDPDAPKLISFGAGPHYCLGAALARLTVEEAILGFVSGPSLVPAGDPLNVEWRSVLGRSPTAIPVQIA
ncbi:MAG TPA: cytochrome P450 [Acidimicrobiales bacterium]